MERIFDQLDTTWKRVLAAGILSGAIILAISVFAEGSYVQNQKIQQESARGEHCDRWEYRTDGDRTLVECAEWPDR